MARPPIPKVCQPPEYDVADIRAIQFLAQSEDVTIQRALNWIIHKAAGTYDQGFVPDDPNGRIAAFIDGRQFVGQQIIKLMKLKPGIFESKKEEPNE